MFDLTYTLDTIRGYIGLLNTHLFFEYIPVHILLCTGSSFLREAGWDVCIHIADVTSLG